MDQYLAGRSSAKSRHTRSDGRETAERRRGGDTVEALAATGVGDRLSYVSTAGRAFLEWVEGRALRSRCPC